MREFDLQVWKDAAWGRFGAALRRGVPKEVAESAWFRDLSAIRDTTKLVGWCTARGVEVTFLKKQGGTYFPASKQVFVSSRLAPLRQSIFLLHECGHHLVGHKATDVRFGMGYPSSDDPDVSKTFAHRVACLDEEMEAWHRGWKLSRRLKLELHRDDFDSARLECIRSYLKWALRPGSMVAEEE